MHRKARPLPKCKSTALFLSQKFHIWHSFDDRKLRPSFASSAVRYGRVPKRSTSMDDQTVSSSPFGSSMQDPGDRGPYGSHARGFPAQLAEDDMSASAEAKSMLLSGIILAISHAYGAHCDETEDKMAIVERKPGSLLVSMLIH